MLRFKELNLTSIITPESTTVASIGAILSPYIVFFYGTGRTDVMAALAIVTLLDWITGIAASIKDKTYTSQYGISGILRTLVVFMFPAMANFLDNAFGTPGFLFYGVTFGLIYHTWQSMTANAARTGWNKFIPKQILDFVGSEIEAKARRSMDRSQQIKLPETEVAPIETQEKQ
jgi:phage-related holin